jgi:RecA-family ATPase
METEEFDIEKDVRFYKPEIQNPRNLFNLKLANEWLEAAKQKPPQVSLFGEFWLEGELAIMFSDTNKGKSTLAMQIAESLARGVPIAPMTAVPPAQKVLYLDFEMTEKQFEARYGIKDEEDNITGYYQFSGNLHRAQEARHDELPSEYKTLVDFLQSSFRELLLETSATVVVVDNITFLKGANENAQSAARLIKALKTMKDRYRFSLLVLAHTPKLPYTSPLTLNDMQGSKMLSNFADTVFALGASNQAKDLRYLKTLKQRADAAAHGTSNVVLFRIKKADDGMLRFEFEGYGKEHDHIVWHREYAADGERAKRMLLAKHLYSQGATQRRIALILETSPATVNRYLKAMTPADEDPLNEEVRKRLQEENDRILGKA